MERDLAWHQDRIRDVDTRSELAVVVEIKIGVARADFSRVKPPDAAIAEEHVLAPAAVIGAITLSDDEEVFMVRLVGNHGDLR